MKIAMVSTVALTTPPRKYGGTELVVAELAAGLTALGHDVTVFATGDSKPRARLKSCFAQPVWPPFELAEMRHAGFAWAEVARALHAFDVVHLHHAAGLPFTRLVATPTVLTIHHCRVDALVDHYAAHEDVAYVAISERQRALLPELNVRQVVHHGLDIDLYPEGRGDGGYVAFLGRFAPEKAPHLAVKAARLANMPLRLGGTHHEVAEGYFRDVLVPELAAWPSAECLGELGHEDKVRLLASARAMLFPIQWEEPFGLVMIESMLIGTPVIAFRHGSAPEVVEHGVTGYLVDSTEEMTACIGRLDQIDRKRCRERARERWCTLRMAKEYASLYAKMIERKKEKERTSRVPAFTSPTSGIMPSAQLTTQPMTPSTMPSAVQSAVQSATQSVAQSAAKELDHGTAVSARRG